MFKAFSAAGFDRALGASVGAHQSSRARSLPNVQRGDLRVSDEQPGANLRRRLTSSNVLARPRCS